jgi:hypothetical protein
MHNLAQGAMASSLRAKAVRLVAKARFKVGFEELPDDLLKDFRRPGRKTEWTQFPISFGDVDSFHGSPSPPFLTDEIDHGVDFLA